LNEEDAHLDKILARGSLGGPRYDEILEQVLRRTATDQPSGLRRRARLALLGGAFLVPALVVLFIFFGKVRGPFTAKGHPGVANGALDVGCAPAGTRACRLGGTLMFTVNAAVTSGYLGAYAERADDPSHTRIQYFPTASGAAPAVAARGGTVVVPEGIQLGPEHRPGRYRVTVWVASRPLDGPGLEAAEPGTVQSRATLEIEILP
jgi:hypothetical protein